VNLHPLRHTPGIALLLALGCAARPSAPAPPAAPSHSQAPVERRPIASLLAAADGWAEVVAPLLDARPVHVEILPVDEPRGSQALYELQVTRASALGAVALHTAALRVDHGWLTILGAGAPGEPATGLTAWNGLADPTPLVLRRGYLVVGYDVLGGFYAVDNGGLLGPTRHVAWLDPNSLLWTDLGVGYSDWLAWALSDEMPDLYTDLRWEGWEAEVAAAGLGRGIHVYPPLWSREGKDIALSSRAPVPMTELWDFTRDTAQRLLGTSW
jgi:hypothetical protein